MIIKITYAAYCQLIAYIDATEGEISGMGEVQVVDGCLTITEVYLLSQFANKSNTQLTSEGVIEFLRARYLSGKDINSIGLWWHSHGELPVCWSEEDLRTINTKWLRRGWMLSLLGNRHGELTARVDYSLPFRHSSPNLPIFVIPEISKELKESTKKEVKAKVRYKRKIRS